MASDSRSRRDDGGIVAIEVVLATPVLLMLIIAVIVVGSFLSTKTQTAGLARDGARAASLGLSLPAGTAIVGGGCPTPSDPTQFVTVRATKNVPLHNAIPFFPVVVPATTTEEVTMRCGG